MSINRKILEKLNDKLSDEPQTKEVIIELLHKESGGIAHYKKPYRSLIEELPNKEGRNEI